MVRKSVLSLVVSCVLCVLFASNARAEASLWLFPDSALPDALTDAYAQNPAYVGEDADPWLTESWVVFGGDFLLDVYNHGRGAGDNTAYGVQLLVAIDDIGEFEGGTVDGVDLSPTSFTYGLPTFSCSGRSIPSHGVYPTYYTVIDLGNLAAEDLRQVEVALSGTEALRVHFDSFAEGIVVKKQGKTKITTCTDLFNPFSHDLTNIGGGIEPPPVCEYELTIDKSGPATVQAGGLITYTIAYGSGASTCDQNNVVVTDTLPSISIFGVTLPALYVKSATGCTTADNLTLTCTIGMLAVGEGGVITVEAYVSPLIAGGTVITNAACVDSAEAEAVCDSTTTTVTQPPINNDAGEDIGTPGFWCNQTKRAIDCAGTPDVKCTNSQKFTYDQVSGWLSFIQMFSRVFDELGRGTTVGDINVLICDASGTDTAAAKLQRHLATLWFNLVSSQVGAGMTLGSLCVGPAALPAGADTSWTVAMVIVASETALLAGADDATLLFWKDVVDFIDNAQAPGQGSCFKISL